MLSAGLAQLAYQPHLKAYPISLSESLDVDSRTSGRITFMRVSLAY